MLRHAAFYPDNHFPEAVEEAVIFLLDKKGASAKRLCFAGSIDHVDLPLRSIVREALQIDCHEMVLLHNHPSGNVDPSQSDINLTRRLCGVLRTFEIRLVDHIIVAAGKSFSFRENGLL